MKHTHTHNLAVALAAAATTLTGPAAQAQSTVTLGGIMDVGVRHTDNSGVGSISSLISGGNNTSRLIFRGSEDLGGGLSAGFHLEHGIAADTGTPVSSTQFWDRRSTVSLASKSLGEVRLGRDFVPSYTNWSRYDPFSHVGVASAGNFVNGGPQGPIRNSFGSGPNTTVRSSNSAQWLMPGGWNGLEGGLMAAAGEGGLAANGQNKVMAGRLGWAAAGMGVSAAYTQTENDLTVAGKLTDTALGGNYDFGFIRLSAVWRRFKQADAEQDNLLIGAVLPLGVGEVKASWQQVDFSGSAGGRELGDNSAQQFGLGYVHNLSRRTALYTTVSRISNDGAVAYAVPGGPAGLAAGQSSTGFEAGVRHNF